jgi:hypothetical protein
LAVIGERCSGLAGFAGAVGVAPPLAEVLVDPAAAPPATETELVVLARAGTDRQAGTVKIEQSATKSVRNRTSTSFVGLRG